MQPFEAVLAEHGPMVMRVCRALLGPADADDAWAETFLAALAAYPRLRAGSDVRAWLVTIAHRKAIDQVRAAGRQERLAAVLSENGAAGWIPSERDPDLWVAVEALPFKQRGAVAYHYIAGLPYAEVGNVLGTSEAAARRAAADGIATLRRTYRNQEVP